MHLGIVGVCEHACIKSPIRRVVDNVMSRRLQNGTIGLLHFAIVLGVIGCSEGVRHSKYPAGVLEAPEVNIVPLSDKSQICGP